MIKPSLWLLGLQAPAATACAQHQPALEMEQRDSRSGEALGWIPMGAPIYAATLDSVVRHAGRYAQRIRSSPDAALGSLAPVPTACPSPSAAKK